MHKGIELQPAPVAKGRTRKALLGSAFTYCQFLAALLSSFFVVPLLLKDLGARQYGVWLSSGEFVGYVALLDFGVFGVLPWLIARADGEKNAAELKRHMAQGLAVAVSVSMFVLLSFLVLWRRIPVVLHLTVKDWHELAGPLCLLVMLMAVSLPLSIFSQLLGGLQDTKFLGALNLSKALLSPILTVGLLLAGWGLYALAVGTALLAPIGGAISFVRARKTAPGLMHSWPLPTLNGALRLFREGIGGWLGGAGVQMMERSSGLVLTFLRNPAMVPVLVCTSKMGQILTQMAWVMPDNALVGLAQLTGEGKQGRQEEVASLIIRLNLMTAGWAACLVLAINPAFVRSWVGSGYFGGLLLNLLLTVEVISGSLVHSLCTVTSVQGNRLAVGLATLLQGALYICLALTLTRRLSLVGLLTADLLAPLFSTLPATLWMLRSSKQLDLRRLGAAVAPLLLYRAGPCLLVAGAYGYWRASDAHLPELMAAAVLISFVYLNVMATQLAVFPLPERARYWLGRILLTGQPATTLGHM